VVFLYGLISFFAALIALPFVLVGAAVSPRWRKGLWERLGFVPSSETRDRILVHLASVGEIISAEPFIRDLLEKAGRSRVLISTLTPTGNEEAKKRFAGVQVVFFPIDAGFIPRLWIRRLGVGRVILFETEIWPLFLLTCFSSGVRVALINARLSGKSFPRYRKIRFFLAPLLSRLSVVSAQDDF